MRFSGLDLRSNNGVVAVTDETDKARLSRRCPIDLSATLLAFFGASSPLRCVDSVSGHVPWRPFARLRFTKVEIGL
jgi:hypothetical protein